MFTHRNNEQSNERGALMIEAIALLGLMTMMSPMIVRQTAERTSEMEEVTIAGQMTELKEALSNWIEANYRSKANEFATGNLTDTHFTVNAEMLAPYLPASHLEGNAFRGNKLMDDFDVGVRAQCTEVARNDGNPCTIASGCYSMTNGTAVPTNPANSKCSRYKMTGVVLSKSNDEIDDKRAARIATMIGADGGYMRTANLVNSLYANAAGTEMQKIMGAQGIWEGDTTNYFGNAIDTTKGGRVAATTIYSSGFSGDFLYRKQVDGLPDANSMFTDLDMGGATNCSGNGCHKINNAGGLEVIGGKILIRSQNTNDDQGLSSGNTYAKIALATDASHIYTNNSIQLSVNAVSGYGYGTHLYMADGKAKLEVYESGASSYVNVNRDTLEFKAGDQDHGYFSNARMNKDLFSVSSGGAINMRAGQGDVDISAAKNISMDAAGDLWANSNWMTLDALSQFTAYSGAGGMRFFVEDGGYFQAKADDYASIQANNLVQLLASNTVTSVNSSTQATYLTLKEDNATMVGKHSIRLHTGQASHSTSAATSGLHMEPDIFTLATRTGTVFANQGSYVGMETGEMNNFDSTLRPFGNNRSGVYVNPSEIRADLAKNATTGLSKSSFQLTNTAYTLNIGSYDTSGGTHSNIQILADSLKGAGGIVQMSVVNKTLQAGGVSPRKTFAYLGSRYSYRARLNVNGETGETTGQGGINASDAVVGIDTTADNGIRPYNVHQADNNDGGSKFKNYLLDPSYTSVMNDIKLTSRGGARLSEALPNYILKGIYELSNSYGSGPWPCALPDSSMQHNCSYRVPYYSMNALGVKNGGWEFHCGAGGLDQGMHPIVAGGGYCSGPDGTVEYAAATQKYVNFNHYKASYTECPEGKFCWAHPFMGIVPAPGRKIKEGDDSSITGAGSLAAFDEGYCPDGYQAVITVTPTVFELGKLLFVADKKPTTAYVRYNPGWQNYADENITSVTGIMQQGTKLGMVVEPVMLATSVLGWKIAMGTVTAASTTINEDGYIWNIGGIPANSWSAIAHTYCYFNPARFTMPNMVIKDDDMSLGGKMIHTAENPDL